MDSENIEKNESEDNMQRLKQNKLIYTSEPNFDDGKQSLIDRRLDFGEPIEDISDDDIWNEAYELASMYYDDEKCNLNKVLDGEVICIADIGTWNGRRSTHKTLGNNLNEVLTAFVNGQSDITIEYDGVNIVSRESHHDGCNYYTFREVKPNAPESFKEKLEFHEPISNNEIKRHTRSLRKYIKDIYGW